jgi:hypothetical protein
MEDFSSLPGILAEIAHVAGPVSALRVAEAKGGTRAYVPTLERLEDGHWLTQAVGLEAARKIARELGGMAHDIPCGPTGTRSRIWAAIERGLKDGMSANQVARLAGVDRTTVFRRKGKNNAGDVARTDQHRLL